MTSLIQVRKRSKRRTRRANVALEYILVMPVLVIATFAIFQFFFVLTVLQTVRSAVDESAREAGSVAATGTDAQITTAAVGAANTVLGVHGLSTTGGTGVRVIVNDSAGQIGTSGDGSLAPKNTYALPAAGQVQVIVIVSFDPAGGNPDPVPNLLRTFGFDLTSRQFEAASNAVRQ